MSTYLKETTNLEHRTVQSEVRTVLTQGQGGATVTRLHSDALASMCTCSCIFVIRTQLTISFSNAPHLLACTLKDRAAVPDVDALGYCMLYQDPTLEVVGRVMAEAS